MVRERSVLITGAAGGIGTAATLRLAEEGFTVYAGIRSTAPWLERVPGVRTVRLDVTDAASVEQAVAEITAATSGLHALINNAGVMVQGPLELVPPEELHRQFDANVFGAMLVTQGFLPLLRAGRGRLVNVSAATARTTMPYAGPVSASKAALESLSDALRVELAEWGVRVVVVGPGGVDTPLFAKAEQAAAAAREAAPAARVALYASALDSVARASARQRPASTDRVVRALVTAVRASRPRPRYVAGRDARLLTALSHLPARLRDRVLLGAIGGRRAGEA